MIWAERLFVLRKLAEKHISNRTRREKSSYQEKQV
jgi:hypothetical protein